MALIKDMEMASGAKASYHRISQIHHNLDGSMEVCLESFKDKDAREAGKAPMNHISDKVAKEQVDQSQPLLPQLYAALKQSSLSGAQDS